jgi:hypothetical protein
MAEKKTSDTKPKTKKKAVKKSPAKKATAKSAATKTATKTETRTRAKAAAGAETTRKKSTRAAKNSGNGKERLALIEQTAYFIAEKRGFAGGDPEQDWLLAEKQVDQMLKEKRT